MKNLLAIASFEIVLEEVLGSGAIAVIFDKATRHFMAGKLNSD